MVNVTIYSIHGSYGNGNMSGIYIYIYIYNQITGHLRNRLIGGTYRIWPIFQAYVRGYTPINSGNIMG